MSQTQIRGNKQIRSGSITNTEIASDANIALSKIAGGTELNNRVTDLESDAFVTREVPSGSVNGSNVTFTLANTPVAGSEQVYLNGLLQDPGAGNSYTISDSTITFLSAPLTNDEIHVSYATGDYMVAPGGSSGSGSFSPFVWSTSEQVYPLEKGVGGVTLYAKEVDFGALPASGLKAVAHNITGLTGSKVHRMETFLRSNSSSVIFGEIQTAQGSGWGSMVSYLTSTNCVIEASGWQSHTGVFRIIYSK